MEYRYIGENIRKYRNRLDLTQDQLADKVGVTWEMISRYERGESSPLNKLDKLAKALGIPVTTLIDDNIVNNYEIPLFIKVPQHFSFDRNNTTVYYNCPKWLIKLDPAVFVVDTELVEINNLLPKENGYIFISPNTNVKDSDLVLINDDSNLKVERFKSNGHNPIGKIMMQEIVY
jgi:transcriptional regulator with XRE-family HTH domain